MHIYVEGMLVLFSKGRKTVHYSSRYQQKQHKLQQQQKQQQQQQQQQHTEFLLCLSPDTRPCSSLLDLLT